LCFLRRTCSQRIVACPAADCKCTPGDLTLWSQRTESRSGIYRSSAQRAQIAPMPHGAPAVVAKAEALGAAVRESYQRQHRGDGAQLDAAFSTPGDGGKVNVVHAVFRPDAVAASAPAASVMGSYLRECVLLPSVAQCLHKQVGSGEHASLADLVDEFERDGTPLAAFFHALVRGTAARTSSTLDYRQAKAAAMSLVSIALRANEPGQRSRLAVWLSSFPRDTNAPYDVRLCLSKLGLAASPTAMAKGAVHSASATTDPRTRLAGLFCLLSFDNLEFSIRAFGVNVAPFVPQVLQTLNDSDLRALHLVGDQLGTGEKLSGGEAASCARKDYEALDDAEKAQAFDTLPPGAVLLFAWRWCATLAHALHVATSAAQGARKRGRDGLTPAPARHLDRDAPGESFGYALGSFDASQYAGSSESPLPGDGVEAEAAAGELDDPELSETEPPAVEMSVESLCRRFREADADWREAEREDEQAEAISAAADVAAGASESDAMEAEQRPGQPAAHARAPASIFANQLGTVQSLPVVVGSLSCQGVLLGRVASPMLAALRMGPYEQPDGAEEPGGAAAGAAAGAASAAGGAAVSVTPKAALPDAFKAPWPLPSAPYERCFALNAADLQRRVGVPLRGDSDPEVNLNRARDTNEWLRHSLIPTDGGFHTLQALAKGINVISKPVLEPILRDPQYRNTEGKRL
jgi:hypothetical protein